MAGKGPLRVIVENFLLSRIPGAMWLNIVIQVAESFEKETVTDYHEFLDYLIGLADFPPPIKRALQFTFKGTHQGAAAVAIAAVIGAVVAIIVGIVSPFFFTGRYATERIAQSWRFPLDLGFAALFRHPEQRRIIFDHFKDQGVPDEAVTVLDDLFHRRISDIDLAKLYYRQPSERSDLLREFYKRGYSTEEAERALEIFKSYPSMQDLLAWTVRDAFSPDTVREFGLHDAFPERFRDEARKLGLDDRFIDAAWDSHWDLPSLQQAFEMLHRLRPDKGGETFTDKDLDILMRVADIAPYFRPKLKAISYAPYTRVDVRRMYHLGVLDLKGVYEAYQDLGYDKTHAAFLTDFTVKDVKDEFRGLTQGVILEAYRDRIYTHDQAVAQLAELHYAPEDIAVIMGIEDFRQSKTEMNLVLDGLEQQYLVGDITVSQVYSALGKYNLEQSQLDFLIKSWDLRKANKVSLLSVSDLHKLYERNIITVEELRKQLTDRGYAADRLNWLIQLLEQEIQERAEDKAEKLRKEQERLEVSSKAKEYQKEKAIFDVEIAEVELQIAEKKVARTGSTDPEQKVKLAVEIAEHQVDIEEIRLKIAELKRDTKA